MQQCGACHAKHAAWYSLPQSGGFGLRAMVQATLKTRGHCTSPLSDASQYGGFLHAHMQGGGGLRCVQRGGAL